MEQSIGTFEELEGDGARLSVAFQPDTFPVRWNQCSATADFFAEYFVGIEETGGDERLRRDMSAAVSYVLNELVENAVKFNVRGQIDVTVGVHAEELVFLVANQVADDKVEPLSQTLAELVEGDPQELFLQRVEENAENPDANASGLGYLTMMNDYEARLGWRFRPYEGAEGTTRIETMARLPIRKE